jgi:hypothetical protein
MLVGRWTGRRKDIKLIGAFCDYSKVLKRQYLNLSLHPICQYADRYDTTAKKLDIFAGHAAINVTRF